MVSVGWLVVLCVLFFLFFQAEDGIRDLVRSRGLGDVYKRQPVAQLLCMSLLIIVNCPVEMIPPPEAP